MGKLHSDAGRLNVSGSSLIALAVGFALLLGTMPVSRLHVALLAWIVGLLIWSLLIRRGRLDHLQIRRRHRSRVFEGDHVQVTLEVSQGADRIRDAARLHENNSDGPSMRP